MNLKNEILSNITENIQNTSASFIGSHSLDEIELGLQWQVHKYMEEESYRELTLTIEVNDNFINIVLGDDLIDYDMLSSSEEQYFIKLPLSYDNLNKALKSFDKAVKNIENNSKHNKDFKTFESELKEIGFVCRNLSECHS